MTRTLLYFCDHNAYYSKKYSQKYFCFYVFFFNFVVTLQVHCCIFSSLIYIFFFSFSFHPRFWKIILYALFTKNQKVLHIHTQYFSLSRSFYKEQSLSTLPAFVFTINLFDFIDYFEQFFVQSFGILKHEDHYFDFLKHDY